MVRRRGGPDAFYVEDALPIVGRDDIERLRSELARTTHGRTRLCVHGGASDALQEMFILLPRTTYIRPHMHVGKVESLLVLDGVADAVFFDADGAIERVARLGDYGSGREFFYRIQDEVYHTLLIRSESLVFKEATLGPFDREKTIHAPWAPDVGNVDAVASYITDLDVRVEKYGVLS